MKMPSKEEGVTSKALSDCVMQQDIGCITMTAVRIGNQDSFFLDVKVVIEVV